MAKYTPEERAERHRALMREKYRAGTRAMQALTVQAMVHAVQGLNYEEAVEYVQAHYRVKEFEKGE